MIEKPEDGWKVPSALESFFFFRERFELQRIAAEIEDEHRLLFAHLPCITGLRLDDEFDARVSETLPDFFETIGWQETPEVRNGNFDSIHQPTVIKRRAILGDVGGQLMPEEVEIDPSIGGSALGASEEPDIELPRGLNVGNFECVVEWSHAIWIR